MEKELGPPITENGIGMQTATIKYVLELNHLWNVNWLVLAPFPLLLHELLLPVLEGSRDAREIVGLISDNNQSGNREILSEIHIYFRTHASSSQFDPISIKKENIATLL